MVKRLLIFIGLLGTTAAIHAQASPTASRVGNLQIGAGYSIANSDYSVVGHYSGFGIYTDFDFRPHLGIEGEFHINSDHSSNQYYEKTYEIGPRYVRTYGRLMPYAKLMYGRGVFNYQFGSANLAYNIFAIGGGADYRIKSFLNLRGDFEYQDWLGFIGPSGQAHGLNPSVLTIGAAYHFR